MNHRDLQAGPDVFGISIRFQHPARSVFIKARKSMWSHDRTPESNGSAKRCNALTINLQQKDNDEKNSTRRECGLPAFGYYRKTGDDPMNIYKRKDDKGEKTGPYWYCFVYKGRRIRRSSGVYNKQDAKDIASAYRTQLCKGEVGIEEPKEAESIPKFDQAMGDFLEWSGTEYAAHPATHRRYKTSSKALLRYFGTARIDRISSEDIERFKSRRAKEKKLPQGKRSKKARKSGKQLRPATINRELACLKHLFKRNENTVPKNPVKNVRFLDEDNEQTRVLSVEEENLYLLAASQPLQDIATLMLETGMRPEEVYRIRRENVHLEQGYLLILTARQKPPSVKCR
jgi:hypothetical protein